MSRAVTPTAPRRPLRRHCLALCLLLAHTACERTAPGAMPPGAPPSAGPSGPSLVVTPLPARPPAAGRRFEPVDPTAAGVTFRHRWAPDEHRVVDFGGAFSGGGAALGDADGDGRVDLLLTRPAGGPRLFLNRGDFRFEDATAAAGLSDTGWTTGAAFVDLTADGAVDLFVGHSDAPNIVYVNDGRGHFTAAPDALGLGAALATVSPAFADCDADGDLDVFLLTNRSAPRHKVQGQIRLEGGRPVVPEAARDFVAALVRPDGQLVTVNAGQRDRLFRNDGGRFVDVSAASGLEGHEMGLGARFFDAEGDGLPDLYVANDFFAPDRVYLNTGGCVFRDAAPRLLPVMPWFSMGVDAGDLDGDGRLDLVATDMAGFDHRSRVVSMGDQTDDAWFLTASTPPQRMRNMVYLSTGTPRFLEVAQQAGLDATGWTWSPHVADLDQDGWADVHFTNGMTRDFSDSDRRAALKATGQWDRLALAAWEAAPPRAEPDRVFRNRGDLRFEEVSAAWGLDAPGISYGAAFGDLDGDGDPDLVVNEFDAPPRLYRNTTADTHRLVVRLRGAGPNAGAVGAVVTVQVGARRLILDRTPTTGFMSAHDPDLMFGLGEATRVDDVEIRWPDGRRTRLGPQPADVRLEVRPEAGGPAAPEAPEPAPVFRAARGFAAALPPPTPASSAADPLAADPVLPFDVGRRGATVAVLAGPGGAPRSPAEILVATAPHEPAQRFVATDRGFAPVGVEPAALRFGGPVVPRVFARGDFDGDGLEDAFVAGEGAPSRYPEAGANRLLRGRGDGGFVDATARAPGLARACRAGAATFADVDADARPDLLIACEWGPVRIFRQGPSGFVDATAALGTGAVTGLFSAIDAGDADGDGDVDLLVGNVGLNTPLRAGPDAPLTLRWGPIADDGGFAALLGVTRPDARDVPLATYDRLALRFSGLVTRVPTWASFAALDVEAVLAPARRGAVRLHEATTLETGWFRNDGGRFVFVPLPAAAQFSPSRAVALRDFDGDGQADLFIGHGDARFAPGLGPAIGGGSLLLAGRGAGTFEPLSARRSGVMIEHPVEAAVPLDANGDGLVDLLVSVTGGPPFVLLRAAGGPPPGGSR
jgi:hypothetical protein